MFRAADCRHNETQANEKSATTAGSVSVSSRRVNDAPVVQHGIGQMPLTKANLVQRNKGHADRDYSARREQTATVSSPVDRSSTGPTNHLDQTSTGETHHGHNMQSWLTSPHDRLAWTLGGKPEDFRHRSEDA
nr:hypothetical protein CFP56_77887 [Quercus suber]